MKKKLQLKDLKVSSFVTSMDKSEKQAVKGGGETFKCFTGNYPTLNGCDTNVDCIHVAGSNICYATNHPDVCNTNKC